MTGDLVCVDGALVRFGEALSPDALLAANFVYQKVAVFGRRTIAAGWAAEIVGASYGVLYGHDAGLTGELLRREAAAVLDANRYPEAGGFVIAIYLIPNMFGAPTRLIGCERQLVWRDHAVGTGVRAVVVPCDVPFAGHRTAASLAAHTCATTYARRSGVDAALCENAAGALVTLDDSPLFVASGGRIFTAPAELTGDSVERRTGIEVCEAAGSEVCEATITAADLAVADEIFAFVPEGIASVCEAGDGGRILSHSLVRHLLTFVGNLNSAAR